MAPPPPSLSWLDLAGMALVVVLWAGFRRFARLPVNRVESRWHGRRKRPGP